MSLLTIEQKPVASEPKELLKSPSVQASLSAIGSNVQQENAPSNPSLESVKFTGTISTDKTTLETVIEFKASAWTVRALAVLISGSNPVTLLCVNTTCNRWKHNTRHLIANLQSERNQLSRY